MTRKAGWASGKSRSSVRAVALTCASRTISACFCRSVGLIMAHKHARLEYLPLGVVAAIVSWNYPFHNTYGPIISALFAGNAIVLKVIHFRLPVFLPP